MTKGDDEGRKSEHETLCLSVQSGCSGDEGYRKEGVTEGSGDLIRK